jgi:hypothetical protein
MISIFQIFKIIIGVVISVFILTVLLRFSGSYMEIGESGKQVDILIDLKKTIEDVYTTGIPSDYEMQNFEKTIILYSPPTIITSISPLNLDPVPTLFVPGEIISVHRGEYDLGWWKFYFIEALPEMKIIFSPLNNSDVVWNTIGAIVEYFPSTENVNTKVRFGSCCNKTSYFFLLDWERENFLYILPILPKELSESYGCEFTVCQLPEDYTRVAISEDFVETNVTLIVPIDNHTGFVYLNTSNSSEKYFYKNPMDIVSLILGGRKFYDYMNKKFLKELGIASDLKRREVELLIPKVGSTCGILYSELSDSLLSIKLLTGKDYNHQVEMIKLNERIGESFERYNLLESEGCE